MTVVTCRPLGLKKRGKEKTRTRNWEDGVKKPRRGEEAELLESCMTYRERGSKWKGVEGAENSAFPLRVMGKSPIKRVSKTTFIGQRVEDRGKKGPQKERVFIYSERREQPASGNHLKEGERIPKKKELREGGHARGYLKSKGQKRK